MVNIIYLCVFSHKMNKFDDILDKHVKRADIQNVRIEKNACKVSQSKTNSYLTLCACALNLFRCFRRKHYPLGDFMSKSTNKRFSLKKMNEMKITPK